MAALLLVVPFALVSLIVVTLTWALCFVGLFAWWASATGPPSRRWRYQ